MSNKSIFFFLLIFISAFFAKINAQESSEIVNLKKKITETKTEKEKMLLFGDIADIYAKNGKLDSAFANLEKMAAVAKNTGDIEQEGRTTVFLGQIKLQQGEIDKGINYLKKAEILLENSQNYDSKGILNQMIAMSFVVKNNNTEAKKYFNKNIEYYNNKKKINVNLISNSYQGLMSNNLMQNNLGEIYKAGNNYLNFVKKNNPEQLKLANFLLGISFTNAKDPRRGITAFKKNIELTDIKDQKSISNTYTYLGMAYKDLKKLDSAKYYLNKSINYFRTNPSGNELSLAYFILADIYLAEKNYEDAESYIKKAIALAPDKDLQNLKYSYTFMLHKIQLAKVIDNNTLVKTTESKLQVEQILANLESDLNYINTTQSLVSPEMKTELYKELSSAYEYLDKFQNAFKYKKIYTDENEKRYSPESMRELSDLQSETELKNQRIRIKLEEETKRISLQKEIELKALRFEYEKKQSLAKTKEEKDRLLLEEDLKRKEIQIKYEQEQKAVNLQYEQQTKLNKIEQEKRNAIAQAELESSKTEKNLYALGVALSLLLLGFAGYSYYQKQKDNKKIAEEKEKSDKLLLNILPFEVAEELKEKGSTSAKNYDEVSVLFTDFVNFTVNSEKIGVQEVIAELNVCFTEFDQIMGRHHLEKIKTIGDAYLAVSGLPVSNDMHAQNAVNAALEIMEFTKNRKLVNPDALDIRIGIHSGPVIAGIVGVKKFAYDIWGDTVNTAARMEQNSEPGKINVSETTYNLTKENFNFEQRGKIETKGKGALNMFFVNKF